MRRCAVVYAGAMDMLRDLLDEVQRQGPRLLLDPRLSLGLLGLLMLVAGKRLYPLAIVAPGLAAGVLLGLQLTAGQSDLVRGLGCAGLALVLALLLRSVERLAVAAAGAFVAVGLATALAPLVLPGQPQWPAQLAGGLLGLLLFPRIYERLLVVLTPAIGALCLAWAAGRHQDLLLVVGLTLVGVVVQLAVGGKGAKG